MLRCLQEPEDPCHEISLPYKCMSLLLESASHPWHLLCKCQNGIAQYATPKKDNVVGLSLILNEEDTCEIYKVYLSVKD